MTEESFSFKYEAGEKKYDFTLKLLKKVDPSQSSYAVRDRGIELRLVKTEEGFWNKLTSEAKFKKFITTDWALYWDPELEEEAKAPAADFGSGMDFSQMMGMFEIQYFPGVH